MNEVATTIREIHTAFRRLGVGAKFLVDAWARASLIDCEPLPFYLLPPKEGDESKRDINQILNWLEELYEFLKLDWFTRYPNTYPHSEPRNRIKAEACLSFLHQANVFVRGRYALKVEGKALADTRKKGRHKTAVVPTFKATDEKIVRPDGRVTVVSRDFPLGDVLGQIFDKHPEAEQSALTTNTTNITKTQN